MFDNRMCLYYEMKQNVSNICCSLSNICSYISDFDHTFNNLFLSSLFIKHIFLFQQMDIYLTIILIFSLCLDPPTMNLPSVMMKRTLLVLSGVSLRVSATMSLMLIRAAGKLVPSPLGNKRLNHNSTRW